MSLPDHLKLDEILDNTQHRANVKWKGLPYRESSWYSRASIRKSCPENAAKLKEFDIMKKSGRINESIDLRDYDVKEILGCRMQSSTLVFKVLLQKGNPVWVSKEYVSNNNVRLLLKYYQTNLIRLGDRM